MTEKKSKKEEIRLQGRHLLSRMAKNQGESARVKKLSRARQGMCYQNAFRVIQHVPGYEKATYVEGMAVNSFRLVFEHGWIEKDGEIIDPTMPADDLVYFPGLRFVGVPGLAKALAIPKPEYTKVDLPIFYRFGWGGADSPEFSQARREADRLAFGEPEKESRSS